MNCYENFDNILLDCDGVLWDGMTPIEGSVETVAKMKELGKKVAFVTNNSTKTRSEYASKFALLGFENVDEGDINTSASAAAEYCVDNKYTTVFVLGEPGLHQELRNHGITVVVDESNEYIDQKTFNEIYLDPDVQAVVIGWYQHFNYRKMCVGSLYLQHGAKLVATNPDNNIQNGNFKMPANGCALSSLERSVDDIGGKKTHIAGKPNPDFLFKLLKKYSFEPERTIMIGDRLDTDIEFGAHAVSTLLVFSGCTKPDDFDMESIPVKPTFTRENIATGFFTQ